MSFSAWRWARQHPADDIRGTYRSTLGFVSTGRRRPTAAIFSESGGKAQTTRCWRTCLVYLSDAEKQQFLSIRNQLHFAELILNMSWCDDRPFSWVYCGNFELVHWKIVTYGETWLHAGMLRECKHIPQLPWTCWSTLPGCWQHMWHFSFADSPGQSHCCRLCFTHTDCVQTCRDPCSYFRKNMYTWNGRGRS